MESYAKKRDRYDENYDKRLEVQEEIFIRNTEELISKSPLTRPGRLVLSYEKWENLNESDLKTIRNVIEKSGKYPAIKEMSLHSLTGPKCDVRILFDKRSCKRFKKINA